MAARKTSTRGKRTAALNARKSVKKKTVKASAKAKAAPAKKAAAPAISRMLKSAAIVPDKPTWYPQPSGPRNRIKPEGWSAPFASSPYNEPPHPNDELTLLLRVLNGDLSVAGWG